MVSQTYDIQLSTDKIKNLGTQLTDIMDRIEMTNNVISGLTLAQKHDHVAFEWMAKKCLVTIQSQNLRIYELLDNIAIQLLECDNPDELQAYQDKER
ncbi:hypothetical protein SUT328_15590 [Streptococcus parasuis]|nr:hypothetical protein SUT380_15430 [Streptococcus parasuis]GIC31462.1 hypothetical protein SUT328_15590 [Streptococcus parasuis]